MQVWIDTDDLAADISDGLAYEAEIISEGMLVLKRYYQRQEICKKYRNYQWNNVRTLKEPFKNVEW